MSILRKGETPLIRVLKNPLFAETFEFTRWESLCFNQVKVIHKYITRSNHDIDEGSNLKEYIKNVLQKTILLAFIFLLISN